MIAPRLSRCKFSPLWFPLGKKPSPLMVFLGKEKENEKMVLLRIF